MVGQQKVDLCLLAMPPKNQELWHLHILLLNLLNCKSFDGMLTLNITGLKVLNKHYMLALQ